MGFTGKLYLLKEIEKATRKAIKDVESRKTALKKKTDKHATDAEKKRKAAAAKSQAAVKKDSSKKVKAQLAQTAQSQSEAAASEHINTNTFTIFRESLKFHKEVECHDAGELDEMGIDDLLGHDIGMAPYIVKHISQDFLDDTTKATKSVWMDGFDGNALVQSKGRSVWTLNHRREEIRKGLLRYVSSPVEELEAIKAGAPESTYNKTLHMVQIYGYAAQMRHSAGETHSLGSARLQTEGQRQVIIANIADVVQYLQEEASPNIMAPSIADVSRTIKSANAATINAFRARGANLWHAKIVPGDLLVQPPGFWVVEQTDGEQQIGFRVSYLPRVPSTTPPANGFAALMKLGGHTPNSMNFYATVFEKMTESKKVLETIHDAEAAGDAQ